MQECLVCNYRTNNKVNFKRHLQSQKHQKNQMHGEREFKCMNCNKIYKFASGLSRHRKVCIVKQPSDVAELLDNVVKHQQTMSDKLDKLSSKPVATTNNITIKMYLDSKCAGAISFENFIQSLTVSASDMDHTRNHGYVNGISNLIIKQLGELGINERPIHSMNKQGPGQFYIKTDSEWTQNNGTEVSRAIDVSRKRMWAKVYEWMQANPNWEDDNTKSTECMTLIQQFAEDDIKIHDNKIIKKVGDAVILDNKRFKSN